MTKTNAPKKRPWLQYHLSTAVVLMFVAAGLLWLNTNPPAHNMALGWPLTFHDSRLDVDFMGRNCVQAVASLLADILIALTLLIAVGFYCERQIWKRFWFSSHLSSVIVMLLVTGGLVWANLRPPHAGDAKHGWPLIFYSWAGLDMRHLVVDLLVVSAGANV